MEPIVSGSAQIVSIGFRKNVPVYVYTNIRNETNNDKLTDNFMNDLQKCNTGERSDSSSYKKCSDDKFKQMDPKLKEIIFGYHTESIESFKSM